MNNHGFVLVSVALALAVVAAAALLLNRQTALGAREVTAADAGHRALFAARGALEHARWLTNDGSCTTAREVAVQLDQANYVARASSATPRSTAAFEAVADTYLSDQSAGANFGGQRLEVRGATATGNRRALVRFNLDALAPRTRVESATLQLYVEDADQAGDLDVRAAPAPWNEGTVTWNTFPAVLETQAYAVATPAGPGGRALRINLTGLVQRWINHPAANFGLVLQTTSTGVTSTYSSRENSNPGRRPRLEITTSQATGTVELVGSATTTAERTLRRTIAAGTQARGIVTLQQGAAMSDTYVSGLLPVLNWGAADTLAVDDNDRAALLKIDLDGVPRDGALARAVLELHAGSATQLQGTLSVYRVTRSWAEGSGNGVSLAGGATWFTHDGGGFWGSPGGDYDPMAVASLVVAPGDLTWHRFDVTAVVRAWLAGTPNHGVMVRATAGQIRALRYVSGDGARAFQPRLTLTIGCPCATPCVQPQGDADLLVVVARPGTLTADDQKKLTLLNAWGYRVTVVGDGVDAMSLASQAAANDVAFILESTDSAVFGTKLTGAAIGVVSEERLLADELGLAANSVTGTARRLDLAEPRHFITASFPNGVAAFRHPVVVAGVTGSTAPDLVALGTWGGTVGLAALDAGGRLYGGGRAAGRRVLVPTTLDTDWTWLAPEGQLMIQRALQWAAGEGATGRCDGNYLDRFDAIGYGNSQGSLAWTKSWAEVGESDGANAGDVLVARDVSNYQLRTRDADNGGEGVEREADLSGAANATLLFQYRRVGLDDAGDYLSVQASATGTSGPWTELTRIAGSGTDASYVNRTIDISAHVSNRTAVRFITSPTLSSGDEVWLDNVELRCQP